MDMSFDEVSKDIIKEVVGEIGFEPTTHWSQTSCATKLRYSPISGRYYNFIYFIVK